MDEYGTFENTELCSENIHFDRKAYLNAMDSRHNMDGGIGNPTDVTDKNGIYYRAGTDKSKPALSLGPNHYLDPDQNTGCCCVKSYRTSLEKGLIKTVIIFAGLLVASILLFFWYLSYERSTILKPSTSSPNNTCCSPACIQTAGEILQYMDRDVKPCDNFFEFACGGWKDSNPMPINVHRWDTFSVAYQQIHYKLKESLESEPLPGESQSVQQLRTGYEACVNHTAWKNLGALPLLNLLGEFGGLPMITPYWYSKRFDLVTFLAKLIRDYNEKFLIAVYIIPDMKNSANYTIHIEQGILPVNREFFSDDDDAYKYQQISMMARMGSILLDTELRRREKLTKNHVPFFILPANYTYTVTQWSGGVPTYNMTGRYHYPIFSNESQLFKHPVTHPDSGGQSVTGTTLPSSSNQRTETAQNVRRPNQNERRPTREESRSKESVSKKRAKLHTNYRHSRTSSGEGTSNYWSSSDSSSYEAYSSLHDDHSVPMLQRLHDKAHGSSASSSHQMTEEFQKQYLVMVKDLANLWDFYVSLGEIMEDNSSPEEMYHPMTMKEFTKLDDHLNITWTEFLAEVTANSTINLDSDTIINISHPSYFEKLGSLLMKTPQRVLANAVLFQLILNMGSEIAPYQEPTEISLGEHETSPWFDCVQKMNSLMGLATGRLFYDSRKEEFDEEIKRVTTLVTDLKASLYDSIRSKTWLDKNTKEIGLRKVNSLTPIIGFPKKYVNNSKLDAVYKDLPKLSANDHFGNVQKLLKFSSQQSMNKYYTKPSRKEFLSSPLDVNAFYSIQRNNIQIPMGILMPPFYRTSAIKAFQYGATGAIIAHELSHGFDVRGRKWDADGNLNNWWGRGALHSYMKKSHCYEKQYKQYPLTYETTDRHGNPIKINSRRTLAENIADSEGLQLSWKAYMANKDECDTKMAGLEEFTAEQLFFIGYGQMWCSHYTPQGMMASLLVNVHSPHPVRVNAAVRNHGQFDSVFSCPKKSTMYNAQSCQIW